MNGEGGKSSSWRVGGSGMRSIFMMKVNFMGGVVKGGSGFRWMSKNDLLWLSHS